MQQFLLQISHSVILKYPKVFRIYRCVLQKIRQLLYKTGREFQKFRTLFCIVRWHKWVGFGQKQVCSNGLQGRLSPKWPCFCEKYLCL